MNMIKLEEARKNLREEEFSFYTEVDKNIYDPKADEYDDKSVLYVNFKLPLTILVNGEYYPAEQVVMHGDKLSYSNFKRDAYYFRDNKTNPGSKLNEIECEYFNKEVLETLVNEYFNIDSFKLKRVE